MSQIDKHIVDALTSDISDESTEAGGSESHMRMLENAGYIFVRKDYVDRLERGIGHEWVSIDKEVPHEGQTPCVMIKWVEDVGIWDYTFPGCAPEVSEAIAYGFNLWCYPPSPPEPFSEVCDDDCTVSPQVELERPEVCECDHGGDEHYSVDDAYCRPCGAKNCKCIDFVDKPGRPQELSGKVTGPMALRKCQEWRRYALRLEQEAKTKGAGNES